MYRSNSEAKKPLKKKTKKTILKRQKTRAVTEINARASEDSDNKKVVTFATQEKRSNIQRELRKVCWSLAFMPLLSSTIKKYVDVKKIDTHKTFLEDYTKAKQVDICAVSDHNSLIRSSLILQRSI